MQPRNLWSAKVGVDFGTTSKGLCFCNQDVASGRLHPVVLNFGWTNGSSRLSEAPRLLLAMVWLSPRATTFYPLLALFGLCTCTCPLLPAKWLWQRDIQHLADVISAICSSSFLQLPACYTQETWWFMVSALLSQNGPRDQLKWWQTVGSVKTKSSYWG